MNKETGWRGVSLAILFFLVPGANQESSCLHNFVLGVNILPIMFNQEKTDFLTVFSNYLVLLH
ncbi:hypothetical protein V7139_03345 [Neobacillus drentensis]|uniref:hypothetical protein n=1 Tax=Neobacillus drentensis TaxID=220684 RepID=UPI003001FD12